MKLHALLFTAAAVVSVPSFAADRVVIANGEAGIQFVVDTTPMRTRAEVRAEARGLKLIGEAGESIFDNAPASMLTREQVRKELMAYGPASAFGGA
jgi:hypothetical protein